MFNFKTIGKSISETIGKTITETISAGGLLSAFALLSRIPLPPFTYTANCVWAYPLVGVFLGTCYSLVFAIGTWLGLSPPMAVAIVVVSMLLLTGALHLDGLADTADGLWGGDTADKRLHIMDDSHLGTYGTGALVIGVLLYYVGLFELVPTEQSTGQFTGQLLDGLIAISILSRSGMGIVQCTTPYAKTDGTLATAGDLSERQKQHNTYGAIAIGAILSTLFIGVFDSLFLIVCGAGIVYVIRKAFVEKIGGITGDGLGATQVILDIALLIIYSIIV